jgi:hypothetical protein
MAPIRSCASSLGRSWSDSHLADPVVQVELVAPHRDLEQRDDFGDRPLTSNLVEGVQGSASTGGTLPRASHRLEQVSFPLELDTDGPILPRQEEASNLGAPL